MSGILVSSNPSHTGPVLRFGSGAIDPATGYSALFPAPPGMATPWSPDWLIQQWSRTGSAAEPEFLDPSQAILGEGCDEDAVLGTGLYAVESADRSGRMSVFQAANGACVYDLRLSISAATAPPAGSSDTEQNLFLGTMPRPGGARPITLDKPLTLSFEQRIRTATSTHASEDWVSTFRPDTNLATAAIGLVLTYQSPTFRCVLFLQSTLADPRYAWSWYVNDYDTASVNGATTTVIFSDDARTARGGTLLPFAAGGWQRVALNVNAMLADAIGKDAALAGAGADDVANWTFDGLYLGVAVGGLQGSVDGLSELDMQFANIALVQEGTANAGAPLISSTPIAGPGPPTWNPLRQDLNGDGAADILWWHGPSRLIYAWQMQGVQVAQGGGIANLASGWSFAGCADANGDGRSEIFWRHDSGLIYQWQMNGTQVVAGGGVGNLDAGWNLLALADFNGDGRADMLWRNASGLITEWQLDGCAVIDSGSVAVLDASWHFLAAGDGDADGKADILWQNSSGLIYRWQMDGTRVVGGGGIGVLDPQQWSLLAAGDFNGDQDLDLVWQNRSGLIYQWQMNGDRIVAEGGIGVLDPAEWRLLDAKDFNGDGRCDLLWQNRGSGLVYEWQMNGTAIMGQGGIAYLDANWQCLA